MKLFDKLFRNKQNGASIDLTRIIRTEVIEGFYLPAIIHNFQYHFINLHVYSDGLVDCWGMVDLKLLQIKLEKNWLVTSIPDDSTISVFNLGAWTIESGKWLHTKETFFNYVKSLIEQLNPELENLHDYRGTESRKAGIISIPKHSSNPTPYYTAGGSEIFPDRVSGKQSSIFYRNDDGKTYLAKLNLFKDGRIEITNLPEKKVYSFETLPGLAAEGIIASELKHGEVVMIHNFWIIPGEVWQRYKNIVKDRRTYKRNERNDRRGKCNNNMPPHL